MNQVGDKHKREHRYEQPHTAPIFGMAGVHDLTDIGSNKTIGSTRLAFTVVLLVASRAPERPTAPTMIRGRSWLLPGKGGAGDAPIVIRFIAWAN